MKPLARCPRILRVLLGVLLVPVAVATAAQPAVLATSCTTCHGDADLFGPEAAEWVRRFAEDVHATVGLSCQDCHGGDPAPSLADDPAAAMDPDHPTHPYRGAPERGDVPAFCGRCHSDPGFMRRFRPDLRVDQEQEYRTSQHGIRLAAGDARVATCVDCHGVHRIARPQDPASPVHPRHVADTCAGCHADPRRMAGSTLADGRPLPVDQFARWRRSVHAAALLDREDLSAPTCNDCHGNHGALPPGLDSIAFVCGQCHGREAELFRAGGKREGFHRHNEYLASAGGEGCASCHLPGEPQAEGPQLATFGECTTCHGNHGILRPTVAMLSPLPETPCEFCHGTGGPLLEAAQPEPEAGLRRFAEARDRLLGTAAAEGLTGDARFDWLVDQALVLPAHQLAGGAEPKTRPEFRRLFDKFRIGKTHEVFVDPATGAEVASPIVRCASCHGPEPALGTAAGHSTAADLLGRMQQLTALTARAERLYLAARRGGVEVREPATAINHAVDAQIELEVLVHSFDTGPESAFAAKFEAGRGHAESALDGARRALDELRFRRRGLGLSLGLIVLVLVALGLKIRRLPEP